MNETLLLASLPTPNGPLHLGHACAFLPFDTVARHQRRRGLTTFLCGGVDRFESHVELVALKADQDPEILASENALRVERDLLDLGVGFDLFVDPGVPAWRDAFQQAAQEVFQALRASGRVERVLRPWPFDAASGQPLPPSLIEGACPACGESAGGTICEACGAVFDPAELIEPRLRLAGPNLEWRTVPGYDLALPETGGSVLSVAQSEEAGFLTDLDGGLESWVARPRDRERVRRALGRRGGRALLTVPGTRGVPVPGAPGQILFSYATVPAFVKLVLAELRRRGSLKGMPSSESGIRMGRTGGPDLLGPSVFSTQAQGLALPWGRPLDFLATHGFLNLEGEKFSTSRGHALWVGELVRDLGVPADAIRLFLALNAPQEGDADFRIGEFATFHNEVFQKRIVSKAVPQEEGDLGVVATNPMAARFGAAAAAMEGCLKPHDTDLVGAANIVLRWVDEHPLDRGARMERAWRAGLAWLVAPLCPGLARWMGLSPGQVGDPHRGPSTRRSPVRRALDPSLLESRIGPPKS